MLEPHYQIFKNKLKEVKFKNMKTHFPTVDKFVESLQIVAVAPCASADVELAQNKPEVTKTKILEEVEDGVIDTSVAVATKLPLVVEVFDVGLAETICKTLPVAIAPGKAVTAPKDALAILPCGIVPVIAVAPPNLVIAILFQCLYFIVR